MGTGGIDVAVVDSVAALLPKAELDGEMGESHMGQHACLMSQALRKLTGTNTLLVFNPREDRRDVRQSRNHHRRPSS